MLKVFQINPIPYGFFSPWIWITEPKTCSDLELYGLPCKVSSDIGKL